MNKKLMAVAVAGALGAVVAPSVFAQSSTVTLSGRLNYYYGYTDNGGAGFTNKSAVGQAKQQVDTLTNSESEWVLSGSEALGGGMSAFFRCATTIDITGGGASNMCGRTSYIGLKGGYGSIDFGNNDAPAKRLMAGFDPFPISATMGQGWQMWNGTANNAGNGNAGVAATSLTTDGQSASFARRQANLITYNMPTMKGFDASVAYTATNDSTATNNATSVKKARMYGAFVQYSNGPLMLGYGYEQHYNYNPAGLVGYTGANDNSSQIGIAYKVMPNLRLSMIYNWLHYDNVNGLGNDMKVQTYGVYGDWNIAGPHTLRVGYGHQDDTKGSFGAGTTVPGVTLGRVGVMNANGGAGDTGAQRYTIEYAYALSKRTELSAAYAAIHNDRYSNIVIGSGGATPNFGENASYFGGRIDHKF